MSFFIISLAIAAVSARICQKSGDEIAYLFAVIAIISLIVTLAIAPWQLQLLIVMVLLVSNKRLSVPPSSGGNG